MPDNKTAYTGTDKSGQEKIGPVETASIFGSRTELTRAEQQDWNTLIKLLSSIAPFLDYWDAQRDTANPPRWMSKPIAVVLPDFEYVWIDYAHMRADYQRAGQGIFNEYEKATGATVLSPLPTNLSGFLLPVVALVVVVLAVAAVVVVDDTTDAITENSKPDDVKKKEAGFTVQEIKDLNESARKTAESVGVTWPFAVGKLSEAIKWVAIAAAFIYGMRLIK